MAGPITCDRAGTSSPVGVNGGFDGAMLGRVRDRLYGDFLMGSRLDEYQLFLESALGAGYRITSVGEAWRMIGAEETGPGRRNVVLRLDVDTDPKTAEAMWTVADELGIRGSYFFRLSTLDPAVMSAMSAGGSEVSYHFEELSTVAKRRRLRSASEALAALPEARDLFASNLLRLRQTTGLPMRVVAAHGDFVNRRLGVSNARILDEPTLRHELGIELETYDEAFMRHVTSAHTDVPHPHYWDPIDPESAMRAGEHLLSILVHPRHWRADPLINARDNALRIAQGVQHRLPHLRHRPRG